MNTQDLESSESSGVSPSQEARSDDLQELGNKNNLELKPFMNVEGCMAAIKTDKNGGKTILQLANFSAEILEDIIRDNGIEEKRYVLVQVTHKDGSILGCPKLPISELNGTAWILANCGPRAVLTGQAFTSGLIREAIQTLSENIMEIRVFTRTGWVLNGDKYFYVHAGGAIGIDGHTDRFSVDLEEGLTSYHLHLPTDLDDERRAIEVALKFLKAAPLRITVPLLAGAFLAPVSGFDQIDFIIFLTGGTGVGKSALAAAVQRFYGEQFSDRNFPGNWTSTANSLQYLAAICKDAVLGIDDFVPEGSCQYTATRFIRNLRNGNGRGRLYSDITIRPEPRPRGLIISSGEDTPIGASILASLLVCPIGPGDVSFHILSEISENLDSKTLPKAMGGYVRFLAGRLGSLGPTIKDSRLRLRDQIYIDGCHRRTGDMIAHLVVGWRLFLEYAGSCGAISEIEREKFEKLGWDALIDAGKHQATFQNSENIGVRGLELIRAVLIGLHAHLRNNGNSEKKHPEPAENYGWKEVDQDEFIPCGPYIGWVTEKEVWLFSDSAFAEAQKLARQQGKPIAASQDAWWRSMAEQGIILRGENGKLSLKREPIGSARARYKVMPLEVFEYGPAGHPHSRENGLSPIDNLKETSDE